MNTENKIKGTLILDNEVFKKLHQEIIESFRKKFNKDPSLIIDYQLYGFNDFDKNQPSVKKMIDEANGLHLNGKYLYNKWRQFKRGDRNIKISREYSYAFFHSLGYADIYEYLEKSPLIDETDRQKQLSISGHKHKVEAKDHYVGYYLGEDKTIIKTKLTVSTQSGEVEWVLYYWEPDGLTSFEYRGNITDFKNNMTIFYKKEYSKTERDVYMAIHCGNKKIQYRPFLKGLYAGYDKNDRPVSGEIIFQRVEDEETQRNAVVSREKINPIIENYLLSKRLVIDHIIPQNLFEISPYSRYAAILGNINGSYHGLLYTLDKELQLISARLRETGSIDLTVKNTTAYNGVLQTDNHEYVFKGSLSNLEHNLKATVEIQAILQEKKYLTGSILGSLERRNMTSGKFCLIDLTQYDLENLEREIQNFQQGNKKYRYSDLFKTMLQKIQIAPTHLEMETTALDSILKRIAGEYRLFLSQNKNEPILMFQLVIETTGKVSMNHEDSEYTGEVKTFAAGIVAINIMFYNNQPYYSQIMLFVGKHTKSSSSFFAGTANFLNDELRPACFKAALTPMDKILNKYPYRIFPLSEEFDKLVNEPINLIAELL